MKSHTPMDTFMNSKGMSALITYHDVSHTLNSIEYVILLLYFVAITIVYTVSHI